MADETKKGFSKACSVPARGAVVLFPRVCIASLVFVVHISVLAIKIDQFILGSKKHGAWVAGHLSVMEAICWFLANDAFLTANKKGHLKYVL